MPALILGRSARVGLLRGLLGKWGLPVRLRLLRKRRLPMGLRLLLNLGLLLKPGQIRRRTRPAPPGRGLHGVRLRRSVIGGRVLERGVV
ncbi:hypothetical protein P8605_50210, partial [Streptomyces sp. T-3]|nr:hypothetical protein [Streptomyces sp. T-3]